MRLAIWLGVGFSVGGALLAWGYAVWHRRHVPLTWEEEAQRRREACAQVMLTTRPRTRLEALRRLDAINADTTTERKRG